MLSTSRDRTSLLLQRLEIDSALHAAFLIGSPRTNSEPAATVTTTPIALCDRPPGCWSRRAPGGIKVLATS